MSFKKAEHLKIDEENNEIALSLFFTATVKRENIVKKEN